MKTYHVGSPDLSTSRSRTCPWDLAHGVPSASLLKGLTLGWDAGPGDEGDCLGYYGGYPNPIVPIDTKPCPSWVYTKLLIHSIVPINISNNN
jgi:hypothetical protein